MKKGVAVLVILIMVLSLFTSCGFGSVDNLKKDISPELDSEVIASEEDEVNDTYDDSVSDTQTLSDSYESYQFMIFGEVYTLPISYTDMLSKGWVLQSQIEKSVSSGRYELERFVKDNIVVYCDIRNFDVSVKSYSECYISKVWYKYDVANSTEFILPGNIKVNESTIDDVIEVYGNEGYRSDWRDTIDLNYSSAHDQKSIYLSFDVNTKILKTASVENNIIPKDFIKSSVNEEEYIKYVRPTSLGTSISDGIISYDGVIYALGCPLSEFLNNGWEIDGSETENDVINSGVTTFISLTYKDDFRDTYFNDEEIDDPLFGYSVEVIIYNFASDARLLKNCSVCGLDFFTYNSNYETFASRFGYSFDLSSEEAFVADYKASGVDFRTNKTDETALYSFDNESTIIVNDEKIDVYYFVDINFTNGMLSGISFDICP